MMSACSERQPTHQSTDRGSKTTVIAGIALLILLLLSEHHGMHLDSLFWFHIGWSGLGAVIPLTHGVGMINELDSGVRTLCRQARGAVDNS